MSPKKIIFFILITVFIGGAVNKHFSIPPIPFAYDEPDYVANSMLFSKFNWGFNTDSFVWSQRWAYDQPHLYHFLSAMFLESKYNQTIDVIINQNQLDQRYDYGGNNIIFGKIGDGKILSDPAITDYKRAYQTILVARDLSFYFYILSGIALISIIYFFCHPALAIPISIFYLNHYFYSISILAQADGLLILLTLTCTLLSLIYINSPKYRPATIVCLGISSGLALSTKLNGGIVLPISILCILTTFILEPKVSYLRFLSHILLLLFISVAIFYWLNPYLYSAPIQKAISLFQHRIDMASNSRQIFTDQTFPVEFGQKVITILKNLYNQTGQSNLFSLYFSISLSILSILTIFFLPIKKTITKPAKYFLLVSSTYSFFLILLYIPMDWPRYYYPAIIENILMTTSVIGIMIKS